MRGSAAKSAKAVAAKQPPVPTVVSQRTVEVIPELQTKIRLRAYQLFEESGHVPGRDLENWLRAENEVLSDDLQ